MASAQGTEKSADDKEADAEKNKNAQVKPQTLSDKYKAALLKVNDGKKRKDALIADFEAAIASLMQLHCPPQVIRIRIAPSDQNVLVDYATDQGFDVSSSVTCDCSHDCDCDVQLHLFA
jgi:hypothetical protein